MIGNVIRSSVCAFPTQFYRKLLHFHQLLSLSDPSSFFLLPKVEERVKEEDEVDTRKGKVIKFGWIEGVLMR